jgi:hypothetical protein
MLLILAAMIIGSSLAAFSLPAASSATSPLSSLRLTPQRPGNDAPFSAASPLPAAGPDSGKPPQRGSLLNMSV